VAQIRESGEPGLVANDDYRDPAGIAGDVVAEALKLPGALRPCCHPLRRLRFPPICRRNVIISITN
jgi:hypothetical protein